MILYEVRLRVKNRDLKTTIHRSLRKYGVKFGKKRLLTRDGLYKVLDVAVEDGVKITIRKRRVDERRLLLETGGGFRGYVYLVNKLFPEDLAQEAFKFKRIRRVNVNKRGADE